jgi:hypothetical protein
MAVSCRPLGDSKNNFSDRDLNAQSLGGADHSDSLNDRLRNVRGVRAAWQQRAARGGGESQNTS